MLASNHSAHVTRMKSSRSISRAKRRIIAVFVTLSLLLLLLLVLSAREIVFFVPRLFYIGEDDRRQNPSAFLDSPGDNPVEQVEELLKSMQGISRMERVPNFDPPNGLFANHEMIDTGFVKKTFLNTIAKWWFPTSKSSRLLQDDAVINVSSNSIYPWTWTLKWKFSSPLNIPASPKATTFDGLLCRFLYAKNPKLFRSVRSRKVCQIPSVCLVYSYFNPFVEYFLVHREIGEYSDAEIPMDHALCGFRKTLVPELKINNVGSLPRSLAEFTKNDTRIVFMGDSLMTETYMESIEHLVGLRGMKFLKDERLRGGCGRFIRRRPHNDYTVTVGMPDLEYFSNSFVRLHDDKRIHLEHLFLPTMPADDPEALLSFCQSADVFVFNWGIWYNDAVWYRHDWEKTMDILKKCPRTTKMLFFTTVQHFASPTGDYISNMGEKFFKSHPKCVPNPREFDIDVRTRIFKNAARRSGIRIVKPFYLYVQNGSIPISTYEALTWKQATIADGLNDYAPTIHFIPQHDAMVPLFGIHKRNRDCTHFPPMFSLYSLVFHAIAHVAFDKWSGGPVPRRARLEYEANRVMMHSKYPYTVLAEPRLCKLLLARNQTLSYPEFPRFEKYDMVDYQLDFDQGWPSPEQLANASLNLWGV